MGCCLLSATGSRKPFLKKKSRHVYFDDSSSRPSAGFCARVGASKTVLRLKRHSHDGAESHSFIFFAPTCTSFILTTPLPQDYRLRKLSLRTVLPLSLSARMAPDDARVKHLFVLNPLVRERSFARSSPFWRSPSYDCVLLWRRLPHLYRAGKGVTLQSRNLEFYYYPDCDCKRRLTVTHT